MSLARKGTKLNKRAPSGLNEVLTHIFKDSDELSKLNIDSKALQYGGGIDIGRELGMDREQVQRDRQMQAVTDYEGFNMERKDAYDTMKMSVESAYQTTFDQYIGLGNSADSAKAEAMKSARAVKGQLEKAIELEFGGDKNMLSKAKQVVSAAAQNSSLAL